MDRLQLRIALNALACVVNSTLQWLASRRWKLGTKNFSLKFNATLPIAPRLLRPIPSTLPSRSSSLAPADVEVGKPAIKAITESGCPHLG
jgi:hypothetical protein